MKYTCLALAGFLFSIVIFISCAKETSFESHLSKGSLKTEFGDCLPSAVNGVYIKDTAVTVANYIDAQIQITTPGYYSIITDTINGMYFQGTGSADTFGINTVHLFAKGTPLAQGTFTYNIIYDTSICTIDVTVTAGSTAGTSVFTVATATGSCPEVSFKGTYKEGIVLGATNTMELDVNVSKAGTYSLNIPAANGITFSGSGTFAGTGIQHIILAGSGTPTAAGQVTETITSGTLTCSFSFTVLPPDNVPDAVFTLNCGSAAINGTYTEAAAMTSANTVKIQATITTAGKYLVTTTDVNGVTFSGAGTFASASATPQDITLLATGTPAAKGPFDYPVSGNGATCTFSINYLAKPAAAVFTLAGSPGACTGFTVNGTYTKGVALNAGNTIIVKVDVSSAGTYTLATNTINGITFSATGTFATTGQQDVTLIGSGTPISGGVTTLMPQAGSSTCTADINVVAPPVSPGILTCKVDGVFTTYNDLASFSTEPDIVGNAELTMSGNAPANSNGDIPDLFMSVQNSDNTAVTAGTYDEKHYIPTIPPTKNYTISVNFLFYSPDAVRFLTSSNFLTTNPPFTIVITSITATRLKGTFSGKVTNTFQGGTLTKTITEGVFDLPIE